MKEKIAILTQPLGENYGGIIQNYALQKVLKDRDYDVITLNRKTNKIHSDFRILTSAVKNLILNKIFGQRVISYWESKKVFKNNELFLAKNIRLSKLIDSDQKMVEFAQQYQFDAYIVGSDQTWRPKYSPNIYNFYLDFLAGMEAPKKISYASSFGTAEWEYSDEQTQKCRLLAQKFNAISVREDSGVRLCGNYLEVDAVNVLDPTLLLTADDYSKLIDKPKERRYLFTYVLDEADKIQNFITQISNVLNLKQTTNQAKKIGGTKMRKIDDHIMPPIEGWLQGFRDSEFVITDSFHGTVFSILNQKPFISIVNHARGASRFESLLTKLGLENRLVYDVDNFNSKLLEQDIDYKNVFEKLDKLRQESFDFLTNSLVR